MSGTFQLSNEGSVVESENLVISRPLSDHEFVMEGRGQIASQHFQLVFFQTFFLEHNSRLERHQLK